MDVRDVVGHSETSDVTVSSDSLKEPTADDLSVVSGLPNACVSCSRYRLENEGTNIMV